MGRKKKSDEIVTEKMQVGTIYQVKAGGTFYLRYQINGSRKSVNLKTDNYDEAVKNYQKILPTLTATDVELVAAQVKVARDMAGRTVSLCLADAWERYSESPDKAMPTTVSEQMGYEATFRDFCDFLGAPQRELHTIAYKDALKFSEDMKKNKDYAVDTHNRKIKRLRKVFNVLSEYMHGNPNPFESKSLLRSSREEQDMVVRRLSFTHEEEMKLLEALEDPKRKLLNKHEIKVIFYLGIYTGQRLKDCVLLRWPKVDMVAKKIECKQFKTGKEVVIPMAPQLYECLLVANKWRTDDHGYICPLVAERYNKTDKNGKNVGNNLVDIDVLRVIRWIGLEPSVKVPGRKKAVTVYGFHSLRHSFASHCAEAGIPRSVVQSILGDDCEILDKFYTHVGHEAQMEAIAAVAGKIGKLSPQERIDKALAVIDAGGDSQEVLKIIVKILRDGQVIDTEQMDDGSNISALERNVT